MKSKNLHEVLAISGDLGWRVVGASSGPNSITSTKLSEGDQPTILVMVRGRLLKTMLPVYAFDRDLLL
jgi:hypothetical protein